MTKKLPGGQIKHGEGSKGRQTPEYRAWTRMKTRCTNANEPSWPYYGGRGIVVCDRWSSSFPAFLSDMGRRPSPGHSLDRYPNPNGNYEPGNVRWATRAEQNTNCARNRPIMMHGETRLLAEWSAATGIHYATISSRLNRGWPVEAALSTPAGEGQQPHAGKDHKTHCSNGHEYTPENSGRDSAGWRFCRVCNRERSLKYMRNKRSRKKK